MSQEYLSSLIAIVVLVVFAVRQVLPRRVALNRLWVTPLLIAVLGYWAVPNAVVLDRAHWPALGAVLLIGALAGVAMGLVNRVEFDPATGELYIPGSFLTLLAWMMLAVVKLGAEHLLQGGAKGGADLATALALTTIEASVIARRLVWYLKCRGMLARQASL